MSDLSFQFGCACELLQVDSPLIGRIVEQFREFRLSYRQPLPSIRLFTIASDLTEVTAVGQPIVAMVCDLSSREPRYVDILCNFIGWPMPDVDTSDEVSLDADEQCVYTLRVEAKRVANASALRSACAKFFRLCDQHEAPQGVRYLNLFLSYHAMPLDSTRAGDSQDEVLQYLERPEFRVLSGPSVFADCSFPFEHLTAPREANDVREFGARMLSSPLREYLSSKKAK